MLTDLKFHHVGIATPNIENTSKFYIELGYSLSSIIIDPGQHVKIAFVRKENSPTFELIEPLNEDSPVRKTISVSGVTPYHCCYEVKDIEYAITQLKKKKFIALSVPVEACAINNKRICFLFNKDIGLIELVEE